MSTWVKQKRDENCFFFLGHVPEIISTPGENREMKLETKNTFAMRAPLTRMPAPG